jgi:catechol 2,3-dioxygenase-like lactoylglutathione lyase family enzyme
MSTAPFRIFDHVDIRVRDLKAARPLYDALLGALGMRGMAFGRDAHVYLRVLDGKAHEAVALVQDPEHVPSPVRIAFAAPSSDDVDRLAAAAVAAGARGVEGPMPCPEYTQTYYAAFFDDADGNKLEIVFR